LTRCCDHARGSGLAHCRGPGGVFALGHLDGDVDILRGVVARAADALDHGGETILIPIHPFRQIGHHGEIAVVEADRAGVLDLRRYCLLLTTTKKTR